MDTHLTWLPMIRPDVGKQGMKEVVAALRGVG